MSKKGSVPQYFRAAHHIERRYSGGLGDVLGLFVGGLNFVHIQVRHLRQALLEVFVEYARALDLATEWLETHIRIHRSSGLENEHYQSRRCFAVDRLAKKDGIHPFGMNFCKNRKPLVECRRCWKNLRQSMLAAVQSTVNELGLQARIRVRLCMLGTSCVVLPSKIDEALTEDELHQLSDHLKTHQLESLVTRIAPERNV